LDARFRPAVDLGVYKALQNFCLFMNSEVSSNRVKQLKFGEPKTYSDSLIAYIPDGSLKLPSILGRPTAKVAPLRMIISEEQVQAIVKLVNESTLSNVLRRVMGKMVLFTKTGAGYCPICEQDHVNDNTHFAIVHNQCICLHCRHSEQHIGEKTTLMLGHLDSSCTNGLRRAL